LELSDEDLAKVNAYRKDKNYRDKDAATYIHGKAEKRPLDSTPFNRELQYGSNLDGYWCYEHMVLQLEDCIDVLQAIHGELYEYVFLFDHSCGHDRKRADGLDARLIRKNFGGKQPKMHPSRILQEKGFLGKFEHAEKLSVGSTQSMVFDADSKGPFYLEDDLLRTRKNDVVSLTRPRKPKKKRLQN
jgi:hypothetical protein